MYCSKCGNQILDNGCKAGINMDKGGTISPKLIDTVEDFIKEIKNDKALWKNKLDLAWFRGEKYSESKLKPSLFLKKDKIEDPIKKSIYENEMLQDFRMRAPAVYNKTPHYDRIDEWLFLAQHLGIPTRLLDWTESALAALFFAINRALPEKKNCPKINEQCNIDSPSPVVWMINPIIFNLVSSFRLFLPLSWNDGTNYYDKITGELILDEKLIHEDKKKPEIEKKYIWEACIGNINSCFASNRSSHIEKYPTALKPQHIHSRVTAQRGCFTIHGDDERGIEEIFNDKVLIDANYNKVYEYVANQEYPYCKNIIKDHGSEGKKFNDVYLKRYYINPDPNKLTKMLCDLKMLGIAHSTLFPELTGLAEELSSTYYSL